MGYNSKYTGPEAEALLDKAGRATTPEYVEYVLEPIQEGINSLNVDTEDLKNATYKNKGYFRTLEELIEAYPTSSSGSRAYVGLSYPYEIYYWIDEESSWVNAGVGVTGGDEVVNLGNYYTKEETHQAIKDEYDVISLEVYNLLPEKEDKLYFCYED